MRGFLLALAATAAMAQTRMVEIPESLKNPAQLRWSGVMPKQVRLDQPAAEVCSIPLIEVPIAEGSRITVVRPKTGSNMPVVTPPAPPCERREPVKARR